VQRVVPLLQRAGHLVNGGLDVAVYAILFGKWWILIVKWQILI
jgi:hypothetical protein